MARVFVTGSADGLGQLAARRMVEDGHRVVLHARNDKRAKEALAAAPGAETAVTGDLSSIAECKRIAAQVNALGAFDAMIHNAGVYLQPSGIETVDGLPHVFAVNTLAPYILTALIRKPKRLVYLTSGLHRSGDPSLKDLTWTERKWNSSSAYADSKLYDVMLAFAVARKWPDVLSNTVDPGWVPTKMGGRGAPDDLDAGAETQAWLATSDDPETMVSGEYFYHRKRRAPMAAARNEKIQERLVVECERISGVQFPATVEHCRPRYPFPLDYFPPQRNRRRETSIGEFSVTETERHPTSRALVASFLFTDLVGYSKGTAAEQYAAKATLSSILRRNLATLPDVDYRIKDTGDGALIAFTSSPEHALYMALAIAEDFGRAAGEAGFPSNRLRTGLHVGSVKESTDLEARPNFVGDGINAAKRIMDFAEPGQITASRAFFDAVGSLDAAYAELFRHVGAPDDKHGRAHELYAVAPSAAVLAKLKLDLAPAAHEPAESAAKGPAPITPKRESASGIETDSRAKSSRAVAIVRRAFLPVIAVIALGAGSLFVVNKLTAPDGPKSPQTAIETVPSPITPKQAAAPPTSEKAAVDSQGPAGIVAKPEAAPPVGAAGVPKRAPPADLTQPATGAPATATAAKTSPRIKPRTDGSSPAPVPAATASDRSSPRCSRIMEKATLGETLSTEEKRELASSCR